MATQVDNARYYGEHLTPINITQEYIIPYIKNILDKYIWVDLFAGKGNLIFPILDLIPEEKRNIFFKKHIYLFDIQENMINYMIDKAIYKYKIDPEIATRNIIQRDNLESFPEFLQEKELPIFHITNPPYLYIGYINKQKDEKYNKYKRYFSGEKAKLQDLYQIALYNDLKAKIKNMIYIIPSNFIFGKSGSNEIRKRFFPFYKINKAFLIEEKIFDKTGVNIGIFFLERKQYPDLSPNEFKLIKLQKEKQMERKIILRNEYNYLAGDFFEDFIKKNIKNNIQVKFYLLKEEIEKNKGNNKIVLLNANKYDKSKGEYKKEIYFVNNRLYKKIKNNILWIRTIDTGSYNGRAGIYTMLDLGVDGILTEKPYRTHPIQIFFEPELSLEKQIKIKEEFNKTLEYLRDKTDSDFMTTYKYSNSEYTRKYLGLTQVKKLLSTIEI